MKHFSRYSGNLKETLKDLKLGRMTCITGDETSYKSAIQIGIRLALTGSFADAGALPSVLQELAADPSVGIHVSLTNEDAQSAEWTLPVDKEGKAKRPGPPIYSGFQLTEAERYCIIPSVSVKNLLQTARSDTKFREALIRRFAEGEKVTNPFKSEDPDNLLAAEASEWDRLIAAFTDMEAEEQLVAMAEHLRSELRKQNAQIKTLQLEVSTSLDPIPDVEAIQQELAQLGPISSQKDVSFWKAQLDSLTGPSLEEATKALGSVVAKIQALKQQESKLLEGVGFIRTSIRNLQAKDQCPLCTSPLTKKDALLTFLQEQERSIEQVLNRLLSHLTTLRQEESDLQDQRAKADYKEKLTAHFQEELAKCVPVEEKKQKRIEELQSLLASAATLQSQHDIRVKKTRELVVAQRMASINTTILNEVVSQQRAMLKRVIDRATETIQKYMPAGRKVRVSAEDVELQVADAKGRYHGWVSLSGTERTELLFAFAAAWTEGAPLRVLLIDDEDTVGLSDKGMRDLFKAIEEAISRDEFTQAIVVTNRMNTVPSTGWTVIKREAKKV